MKTRVVHRTICSDLRKYRCIMKTRFAVRSVFQGFKEAFRLEDQDRRELMVSIIETQSVFSPIGLFFARLQEVADFNQTTLDQYNIYWHMSKAFLTNSKNGLDLIGRLLVANDPDEFYKYLKVLEMDRYLKPLNRPLSDNWTLFAAPHVSGRIIVLPSRDHM